MRVRSASASEVTIPGGGPWLFAHSLHLFQAILFLPFVQQRTVKGPCGPVFSATSNSMSVWRAKNGRLVACVLKKPVIVFGALQEPRKVLLLPSAHRHFEPSLPMPRRFLSYGVGRQTRGNRPPRPAPNPFVSRFSFHPVVLHLLGSA